MRMTDPAAKLKPIVDSGNTPFAKYLKDVDDVEEASALAQTLRDSMKSHIVQDAWKAVADGNSLDPWSAREKWLRVNKEKLIIFPELHKELKASLGSQSLYNEKLDSIMADIKLSKDTSDRLLVTNLFGTGDYGDNLKQALKDPKAVDAFAKTLNEFDDTGSMRTTLVNGMVRSAIKIGPDNELDADVIYKFMQEYGESLGKLATPEMMNSLENLQAASKLNKNAKASTKLKAPDPEKRNLSYVVGQVSSVFASHFQSVVIFSMSNRRQD